MALVGGATCGAYTYSGEKMCWLAGSGEIAPEEEQKWLTEDMLKRDREDVLGCLSSAESIFHDMKSQWEKRAAIKWLVTTFGLDPSE